MPKTINNLSGRLRYVLQELNISQTELANRIKVKPQIIQYLCQGKSEKSKFTFDIAEALNVDVSWLANGSGISPIFNTKKSSPSIPLLSFSQIKKRELCREEINLHEVNNWIPIQNEITKEAFGFVLNDKSMLPKFEIGTLIIVEPILNININEILNNYVLVYLKEQDFIVFRQIKCLDTKNVLVPLNNVLYKNLIINDEDKILGSFREARWSNLG